MNATGPDGLLTQINVLYRLRTIYRQSKLKATPHRIVTEKFKKALRALEECRKFERLIESTTWPVDMSKFRLNIFRGTRIDEEAGDNSGHDFDILPSLLTAYRERRAQLAPQQEAKYWSTFKVLEEETRGLEAFSLKPTEQNKNRKEQVPVQE